MLIFTVLLYLMVLFSFTTAKKITVTEPDESDLERPCQREDLKCIRKQFSKHGWHPTTKEHTYKDNKVILHDTQIEMPSYNISNKLSNVVYSGLERSKLVEFYINKKSGNAVFSVEFSDFDVESDVQFFYHRTAKEDLVISTTTKESYKTVKTTTIIPKGRNGLQRSSTHANVPTMPVYSLGAGLEDIKNEEVQNLFAAFNSHPELAVRELYRTRAPFLAQLYVERYICTGWINRC